MKRKLSFVGVFILVEPVWRFIERDLNFRGNPVYFILYFLYLIIKTLSTFEGLGCAFDTKLIVCILNTL